MAMKPLIQFPMFAPPTTLSPAHNRPPTEVRFSRWNNANAERFNREKRTQKEIEDQIRFEKRFDSALNIAHSYNPATPVLTFKSTGTPSVPSKPSIPGKKSKYSKIPPNSQGLHPAFKPLLKRRRFPMRRPISSSSNENEGDANGNPEKVTADVKIDEKGVSYEFPEAPFVYQYSYTETPKLKPLGIREPLVAPFEPATMGRPWTGRKPLPPSKKKLPEFDSFRLPPPNKKGVKPVQSPGPYLAGTGPKYVKSRDEILGEPLTKEEVQELVISCRKTMSQLNMGRDGFTHNMLDNIHALWKRRRVCKIRCLGVCTVDMDNVRKQLEEKTGGQVIYSRGGVIYLFRGRNYNHKTRPRFPLMLWRPVTPVYPRLIKQVPEGLTLEEATQMRKKGRILVPICKLGKNGVYCDLVKSVREAFEACELVRINCQGLNASDYKKIGAKLKDLVPCVLISFENEHILMWRGQDWKSSLTEMKNDVDGVKEREADAATFVGAVVEGKAELLAADTATFVGPVIEGEVELLPASTSSVTNSKDMKASIEDISTKADSLTTKDVELEGDRDQKKEAVGDFTASVNSELFSGACEIYGSENPPLQFSRAVDSGSVINVNGSKEVSDGSNFSISDSLLPSPGSETMLGSTVENDRHSEPPALLPVTATKLDDVFEDKRLVSELSSSAATAAEGVHLLLKLAVESGSAIVLEDSCLDADIVYKKAVTLAKSAPPGPVFRHRPKKLIIKGSDELPNGDSAVKEAAKLPKHEIIPSSRKGTVKKSSKGKSAKDIRENFLDVVPHGSLRVDELAKLLA